jgi:hypothetical protein
MENTELKELPKFTPPGNETKSAFPTNESHLAVETGLTKLEYFTALAMQGLCANQIATGHTAKQMAERAVKVAKITIQELSK